MFIKSLSLVCLIAFASSLYAEDIVPESYEMQFDKFTYKRPTRNLGFAGEFVFKKANINTNGVAFNVENKNNIFDAKVFMRPNFLGFTTSIGSFGVTFEKENPLTIVDQLDVTNASLILDDTQLNLSGLSLTAVQPTTYVKLDNFRIYCQRLQGANSEETESSLTNDCFNFLTLNNAFSNGSLGNIHYIDTAEEEKLELKAQFKSIDLRPNTLSVDLNQVETISGNDYFIKLSTLNFQCPKDPTLKEIDPKKITEDCLRQIKIAPFRAQIEDKKEKSKFDLNITNFQIKDEIAYINIPNGKLSDPESDTFLKDVLVNCRKSPETDVMDITAILSDCVQYSKLSIGETTSTNQKAEADWKGNKPDSTTKNILININNNKLILETDVRMLGLNHRVKIYGLVIVLKNEKALELTVTDTKLPFGLSSVKLLMYYLKKNFVSKDIKMNKNVIRIYL